MVFNYSKLKGRIREKFSTQEAFSDAISMSSTTLSYKLNGKGYFSQAEIFRAADVLGIDAKEIPAYFFTPEVE